MNWPKPYGLTELASESKFFESKVCVMCPIVLDPSTVGRHPCLAPDLKGRTFSLSTPAVLSPLRIHHRCPSVDWWTDILDLHIFNTKKVLSSAKQFFILIEMIVWASLFFIPLMCSITSIDFSVLSQFFNPGSSVIWSWCVEFLFAPYLACWHLSKTFASTQKTLLPSRLPVSHCLFLVYSHWEFFIYEADLSEQL